MEDLGYPHDVVPLVGKIYSQSTTTYTSEYFGQTQPILIQQGTIQVDTLSLDIFIIFLEPPLMWLHRGTNGYTYKISYTTINYVAYANDLLL